MFSVKPKKYIKKIQKKITPHHRGAYFKGLPHYISGYIAQDSSFKDADIIMTYAGNPDLVHYYMGDGELVSCELSYPADLVKKSELYRRA